MNKIIIFGATDFGRMMKYYIEKEGKSQVVAFTMNQVYIGQDTFYDLPVIAFEKIETDYPIEEYEILIAIGYSNMNDSRKKIFFECKEKGYKIASYIYEGCDLNNSIIGEGNIILYGTYVFPFAEIGDCNIFWDHVLIAHDTVVGNFNTFAAGMDTCGYVKIGDNCFFGKHCVVKENICIADYTLVGAMSYVAKDTNKYDVVVPASSSVIEGKKSFDFL